jgi:hypothetical protein
VLECHLLLLSPVHGQNQYSFPAGAAVVAAAAFILRRVLLVVTWEVRSGSLHCERYVT